MRRDRKTLTQHHKAADGGPHIKHGGVALGVTHARQAADLDDHHDVDDDVGRQHQTNRQQEGVVERCQLHPATGNRRLIIFRKKA